MLAHILFQKLYVKLTHIIRCSARPIDVDIDIVWVNTWYDPGKEADAAKVMIAEGCDMVAQHTDSPLPLQTAEKAGVLGFN